MHNCSIASDLFDPQIHVQTAKFLVIREVFLNDQARITFIDNGAKTKCTEHALLSVTLKEDERSTLQSAGQHKVEEAAKRSEDLQLDLLAVHACVDHDSVLSGYVMHL